MPWSRPRPSCAWCVLTALLAAHVARRRAARRRCWRAALAVDAVVGCREDAVHLPERGGGLVEVEAECDEVVDRGLRHSSPGSNGDDSEAAREVPLPRVTGGEPSIFIGDAEVRRLCPARGGVRGYHRRLHSARTDVSSELLALPRVFACVARC